MSYLIRPAHPSDIPQLYRICLRTGHAGEDASSLVYDPDLLGHLYLGAYLIREPHCAFVLTRHHRPCGYIVGTRDTRAFNNWMEQQWLPTIRQQYSIKAARGARTDFERGLYFNLHRPLDTPVISQRYPAHLHINLLSSARGSGGGRRLMHSLVSHLSSKSILGIHLRMSAANTNALRFYQQLGFTLQEENRHSLTLTRPLPG